MCWGCPRRRRLDGFFPYQGPDAETDNPSEDHTEHTPQDDMRQALLARFGRCRGDHGHCTSIRLDITPPDQREVVDGVVLAAFCLCFMIPSGISMNIRNTHKMIGVTATNSMVRRSNFRCIK